MTLVAGTTELDRLLHFGEESYPFVVCAGPGSWGDLTARLAALDADRFVLVVDSGVPEEIRRLTHECLLEAGPVTVCEVTPGEENKTPEATNRVMATALRDGISRNSVVVAEGGGQVGNIAGHAAAQLFRGAVRLFHIPTTLLALSDSVVSRKQAVNLVTKNTVGAFKTPDAVWSHLDILRYLPADHIRSAFCEGAKNLIAILPDLVPEFAELFRPGADYTDGELIRFIDMCLDAKQEVVRHDPNEKGRALVLEYGHTAGHAAELLCDLHHGIAIGVGGLVAARVGGILGIPGSDVIEDMHEHLLHRIGAPVTVPRGLSDDAWLGKLLKDNKRGYRKIGADDVEMVLLEKPGVPQYTHGRPLTQVPAAVVLQAIREREAAA